MKNSKPDGNSRRKFIRQATGLVGFAAVASVLGCEIDSGKKTISGEFKGANHNRGHLLRKGNFPPVSEKKSAKIVIVGSGIAGLSAAWFLQKNEINDFILLELEDHTGGNSASGKGSSGEFPWGAHYLPVPGIEQPLLMELLKEWGIISKLNEEGQPVFAEEALCFSPQERLFKNGKWQDGLVPKSGVSKESTEEISRFFEEMESLKRRKGTDGKFVFALPLDNSSQDTDWLKLDTFSMTDWMKERKYDSSELNWYVNYCCEDDFGTSHKNVSAWAGLHYFASRRGGGPNANSGAVLTWPAGNGNLANLFYQSINQKLPSRIFPAHLAWKVEDTENGAVVSALNCLNDKSVEFQCSKTILALPFFVRKRIFNLEKELASFSYAPWVVVNIHIENFEEELGYWDNVPFESKSLGYIVSTHQDLKGTVANQKTLTWYLPLVNSDPVAERKSAREKEASYWIEQAVLDIEKMHERIREYVTGAEAWVWGHGMVRPVPGMIWGEERNAAKSRVGNVHFAHSDLSGMSVFEEAFYQGIRAACEVANLPFPGELKS